MNTRTESSRNQLDGCSLAAVSRRVGGAAADQGDPQTAHAAGDWNRATDRGLAGAALAATRPNLHCSFQDRSGHILIDHTGEIGINSSYWPIYFLPAVTAAEYFSPVSTLLWTALASAAYCSYLYPALQDYEMTREGYGILAIRIALLFPCSHGGEPLRGGESAARSSATRN